MTRAQCERVADTREMHAENNPATPRGCYKRLGKWVFNVYDPTTKATAFECSASRVCFCAEDLKAIRTIEALGVAEKPGREEATPTTSFAQRLNGSDAFTGLPAAASVASIASIASTVIDLNTTPITPPIASPATLALPPPATWWQRWFAMPDLDDHTAEDGKRRLRTKPPIDRDSRV